MQPLEFELSTSKLSSSRSRTGLSPLYSNIYIMYYKMNWPLSTDRETVTLVMPAASCFYDTQFYDDTSLACVMMKDSLRMVCGLRVMRRLVYEISLGCLWCGGVIFKCYHTRILQMRLKVMNFVIIFQNRVVCIDIRRIWLMTNKYHLSQSKWVEYIKVNFKSYTHIPSSRVKGKKLKQNSYIST